MNLVHRLTVLVLAGTLVGCGDAPRDASGPDREPLPPGSWAGPLEHAPPQRILVLMMDTLRADHLGAYGSELGLTPHMDAFAEQAVVFEHAYATASWTRPTVASMLTGRYPTSHTADGRDDALPAEALLLPEILAAQRDATSFGITTNANISAQLGFGQGFDEYGPLRGVRRRSYPEDRIGLVPADEVAAGMLERIDAHDAAGLLFGFVQFIDPHDPYYENPDHNPLPAPPRGEFAGSRAGLDRMMEAGRPAWTARNIAWLEWLYAGEVAYLDHAFGEFIAALRERGIYDDSMIIVVSDHGEAFWEHGQRGHGKSLYEEEARVPFMIKFAGMPAEHARRVDRPVSVVDLAPTVLEATGIDVPAVMEGRSLIPFIETGTRERRLDFVFSELRLFDAYSEVALRDGPHKMRVRYWHQRSGPDSVQVSLHDLAADPGEQRDLAESEPHRDAFRDLLARLSVWEADVSEWSLDGRNVDIRSLDEDTLEQLRGLGYIQ